MIGTIITSLATLTLIGDIMLAVMMLLFLSDAFFKTKYVRHIATQFSRYAYIGIFIVSAIATLGSLFFSEVAKYTPCILCWYQRIFMYPQPLLAYLAIVRNEKVLTPYLLLLNAFGTLIALYHYIIQRSPQLSILPCEASGPSCTFVPSFHYGYISIPMMALTAFLLNILFLLMSNSYVKNSISPTHRSHRSRKVN